LDIGALLLSLLQFLLLGGLPALPFVFVEPDSFDSPAAIPAEPATDVQVMESIPLSLTVAVRVDFQGGVVRDGFGTRPDPGSSPDYRGGGDGLFDKPLLRLLLDDVSMRVWF
jgi:hypothetical protein